MPKFGKTGLRTLKVLHLLTAGLWVGGSFGLNAMLLSPGSPSSGGELVGYNEACVFVDDLVVIPGAVGCLVTGLLFSVFSHWGFFKHRWLAVKWVLTVLCILFGTFFLGPRVDAQPAISTAQGLGALQDPAYLANRAGVITGGLVMVTLIFLMVAISVLRPWKASKV
jgi:putative copper export protein